MDCIPATWGSYSVIVIYEPGFLVELMMSAGS